MIPDQALQYNAVGRAVRIDLARGAALSRNLGFSPRELRRIQRLVAGHEIELLEASNAYFGE